MRSGSWADGPVLAPAVHLSSNGVDKPVTSVSVVREIPSVLPGQVGSVGGMTAATGSVDWPQDAQVDHRAPTPWTTNGYPSRGERVGVWASDGTNEHKVFTGITDGTQGRFSDPSHSTDLVDDVDALNRPFSMGALARIMPPRSTAADGRRRMIGLVPQYFTNRVLREAGFHSTPPLDGYCVASAPLVGSTWPERGELENSYATNDEFGYNRYNPTFAWSSLWGGQATANAFASYNIDTNIYGGQITATRPLNISMMVGVTHRTSGYVAAAWNDLRQIRLAVTSTRAVSAQTRDADGVITTLVSISEAEAPGYRAATLRVTVPDTTNFTYTLRTDTGVEKSVTAGRMYNTGNDPVTQMWVYAPDNRIGGAMVSYTAAEWTYLNYTQTAWLDSPVSTVNLEAIPAIESGNCLDLLRSQAEAECAAFWIDEDGVLRWKSRTQFTAGDVVRTLTADTDLLDVQFRLDGQDARRKVSVKYRQASVSTSRSESLVVHEGQRHELSPSDTIEEWVKPGADEDWLQVDTAHDVIVGNGGTGPMNTGRGTFLGFVGVDTDGDEVYDNTGFGRTTSFAQIGAASWLYKLTYTTRPAGVDRVITKTLDDTVLKPAYRDRNLPLVRAMGRVTWTDQVYTPGVTGPSWASDLEHDASWFVQDATEVQTLGQWIADKTSNPEPVIEGVNIIPDPRLQLGDKVTVSDPDRTGVEITGVITSIQQALTDGDYTMSLRLLVTTVTTPNVTLTEFDGFYADMTLAEMETLRTGETLTGVDSAPLTN